ncbi:Zinc-regulated transporter 3 [Cercospora zeina]
MPLSNDDRGWIMSGLSGVACIFGASFICVDIIVRQFPGKKGWRIQDSDAFLSTSLSLSFGVMLFSALYNMLPSAKSSLMKGGSTPKEASWILIACFAGGVIGIQLVSRLMHRCVPHNVVDCEHEHEDEDEDEQAHKEGSVERSHHEHGHQHDQHASSLNKSSRNTSHGDYPQRLPMQETRNSSSYFNSHQSSLSQATTAESEHLLKPSVSADDAARRPNLQARITSSVSKIASGKAAECECDNPCYGYSDPCQANCFKTVAAAGGLKVPKIRGGSNRPAVIKSATVTESTPLLHGIAEEPLERPQTRARAEGAANSVHHHHRSDGPSDTSSTTVAVEDNDLHTTHSHNTSPIDETSPEHHHHHVPTNAFLNIGLQTSIAIALHKLPEGFITYATNHANPNLGVSVFLALFMHNITEGFAMALPLYLAINNRFKAMVISFVLGGLSQPLGAGVAAVWFKLAGKSNWAPSESGYGAMFAITAGIMTSVGLQLFAESLDLTHSKHLCFIGAFAGMCILGASSALTA